jgi:hypothetical protein
MDESNTRVHKALIIAGSFVGWLITTVFIMMGLYQLMVGVLVWDSIPSGTFAFIIWLIMLIAPPVMISSYLD